MSKDLADGRKKPLGMLGASFFRIYGLLRGFVIESFRNTISP